MSDVASTAVLGPCFKAVNLFWSALRVVVMAFALVAGLALLAMVGIICVDIVMRLLGRSFASPLPASYHAVAHQDFHGKPRLMTGPVGANGPVG